MPFVLDASVTMGWCFEDEAGSETDAVLDRLTEDPAVVPSIWKLEVANVMLVAERGGRLTEFQAARFAELLAKLPINVDQALPAMTAVMSAGRRHGLSAYDAAYLVLAERDGIALASCDGKLQAAARAAGVPLLIDSA